MMVNTPKCPSSACPTLISSSVTTTATKSYQEYPLRSRSMPYPSDVDLKLVPNRHDTVPFTHTNSCANSAQDGGPRQVMPGKDSGIGSDLEVCSPSRRNEKMPSSDCDDIQKVESDLKSATIRLHYYPEGGWGWVICACAVLVEIVTQSLHTAYGMFYLEILYKYGQDKALEIGCLGSMSICVAYFISPVVVSFCRRKSTRLTAVIGGLVAALGCLFSSFTSQFQQLYFSYGAVVGIGVGLCRITANLMVGQYFKRKREAVEVIIHCATGVGMVVMSAIFKHIVKSIGWRLGLQMVTGLVFSTFFLGIFYRSASLYHPQRRAILHLKNQKRKVKDKVKPEDKSPVFDCTTLQSRTVQILLASTSVTALGINSPLVYLSYEAEKEGVAEQGSLFWLQMFLGFAMMLGSIVFGLIVVRNSSECRIARHYLCHASGMMLSVALLALTAVYEYHGYIFFVWIYGMFWSGYNYSLKMFIYQKVRARNFARTWSFVQWFQAIPTVIGIPTTGYINHSYGRKSGFYFSSMCVLAGSIMMLLIEVHQRRVNHQRSSSIQQSWLQTSSLTRRVPLKDMTSDLRDQSYNEALAMMTKRQLQALELIKRPELTCISEEGMLDLPDNILDELEYFDINDCMTSCDQVENYLMLSEYENNLNKTHELHMLKGQAPKKRSVVRGLTRKFLPPGSSQSLQDKGQLPSMADSTSIIRPSSTEVSQVVTNIAKATSV